ncbi:T9SS type A sorting domain-containing protein, partial [Bacteroidota bacterium]
YGTNVTTLVPTIAVSADATINPLSGVAKDFSNPVPYTVTAEDVTEQIWTITVNIEPNTENDILTFVFETLEPDVNGIVDVGLHTVIATVPYGTDITALVPTITVSADATINPLSGAVQNFTSTVNYTVTAEDATAQIWEVTVNITEASSDATLSDLLVDGTSIAGFVSTTYVYVETLPFGTTTTPVVTATENDPNSNAVVNPATDVTSATDADRTTTVTVTAEDASTQDYTILFNVAANDAKILTSFSFVDPAVNGVITEGNHTVAIEVPYGTDVTNLIANFETSGSEVKVEAITQISGTTPNNFTNPVTYTVVAEDASTQDYIVTVSITAGNTDATLSSLTVDNGTLVPVFDAATIDYTVELPYGTTVEPLVTATENDPNANAVITQATDVEGDLAARTATVVVTAEDGNVTKTYTIVFSIALNSDATLSALTVNSGTLVPAFDAVIIDYTVELPYGTTTEPVVSATENDANANAVVTQATDIEGDLAARTATVAVTAEDGSTTKTYTVIFTVALNNDATVTSTEYTVNSTALTISGIPFGTPLASFESNLTAAEGATFETYEADGATVATDLATDYKVIVTAEDGTTTKTYTVTVLTGTNFIINNIDIKLYPNPSNGLFKLELSNANNEEFFVDIYDVIGKKVYTATISKNITIIDLSEMNIGIYYVSIKKGDNRKVSRIIIH